MIIIAISIKVRIIPINMAAVELELVLCKVSLLVVASKVNPGVILGGFWTLGVSCVDRSCVDGGIGFEDEVWADSKPCQGEACTDCIGGCLTEVNSDATVCAEVVLAVGGVACLMVLYVSGGRAELCAVGFAEEIRAAGVGSPPVTLDGNSVCSAERLLNSVGKVE